MQAVVLDNYFLAKYAVRQISPRAVIDFAHQTLSSGTYSDNLLDIVDMEPPNSESVFEPFEAYLAESQKHIPSCEEATKFFLKYHIEKMASGEVDAHSQCRLLLNDIDHVSLHENITKYVGDNLGIEYIYAWYHEDYESPSEINRQLILESQKWLERQLQC